MFNDDVTAKIAREFFEYDKKQGILRWKYNPTRSEQINARYAGLPAGGWESHAQAIRVILQGRKYMVHRLIWLIVKGRWPTELLEHIDGNPKNNRIENLREISFRENRAKRIKQDGAVYIVLRGSRWHLRAMEHNKPRTISTHKTERAAKRALRTARKHHV